MLARPERGVSESSVKIGYARVSTEEQNLSLQRDALERAGVARVFEDHAGGASKYRPGLDAALNMLGPGDTLVVWKLDRLGRTVQHLINLVHDLGERGIEFVSLSENIDTTTAGGRLVFHMMGALAEFERSLIVERTKAGMASARSRGRHLGRSPSLNPSKVEHARMLIDSGASVSDTARTLNVGRSTLYRALRAEGAPA
ncbi:recombinase family protein [Brevundimonas sp. 2P06AA]|jgi:DNA invertase Pin-like site-specific DNA recombinase